METADAGLGLAVVITEHIPVHDTMVAIAYAEMEGAVLSSAQTLISFHQARSRLGIMPSQLSMPGSVGVVSRSGTHVMRGCPRKPPVQESARAQSCRSETLSSARLYRRPRQVRGRSGPGQPS